jgi:hypothetical protein
VLEEKPSVEITFEEFHKQRKELSTKAQIWNSYWTQHTFYPQ